jgi:hypothetical protein
MHFIDAGPRAKRGETFYQRHHAFETGKPSSVLLPVNVRHCSASSAAKIPPKYPAFAAHFVAKAGYFPL